MLSKYYQDVIKMLSRCYQDVINMLSRCYQDVKIIPKWYQDVIKMLSKCYQDVIKMLSRCYQDRLAVFRSMLIAVFPLDAHSCFSTQVLAQWRRPLNISTSW
jgi:hypothetical protein